MSHDTTAPSHGAKRLIIGFVGRAGAGKTTAATELYRYGFHRVRFAGPLKAMMRSLGLTVAEVDGDRKELPCELLCGKTPRWAMQTIGTEWGRDIIGASIWENAWRSAVNKLPDGQPVVVDDVRFANEADAIRGMGGIVISVVRPGAALAAIASESASHTSELMDFEVDQVLVNDGTPERLAEKLRVLMLALAQPEQPEQHPLEVGASLEAAA